MPRIRLMQAGTVFAGVSAANNLEPLDPAWFDAFTHSPEESMRLACDVNGRRAIAAAIAKRGGF